MQKGANGQKIVTSRSGRRKMDSTALAVWGFRGRKAIITFRFVTFSPTDPEAVSFKFPSQQQRWKSWHITKGPLYVHLWNTAKSHRLLTAIIAGEGPKTMQSNLPVPGMYSPRVDCRTTFVTGALVVRPRVKHMWVVCPLARTVMVVGKFAQNESVPLFYRFLSTHCSYHR